MRETATGIWTKRGARDEGNGKGIWTKRGARDEGNGKRDMDEEGREG